jgi:hypothetical protein
MRFDLTPLQARILVILLTLLLTSSALLLHRHKTPWTKPASAPKKEQVYAEEQLRSGSR